jgi:hypothetical protein
MASLRDKSLTGSKIVMLLFLMMTTLFMMPGNVWGEEIYKYTDKDGNIFVTNIPPEENIKSNTRKSDTYQDSTSEERLHWGRDNAIIDEQNKGKNRQRKAVKDSKGIDAGRYKVRIKKIGSNLYQDVYTHMIIKTAVCAEVSGRDGSVLDWSGVSGELYFKNTNKSCIVEKVYK